MSAACDYLADCSIEYDGPAPVSTYFAVRREDGAERATLRGRELHGRPFRLPDGVTGLVRIVVAAVGRRLRGAMRALSSA